ncbi:hypothetical protein ACFWAT_01540 [Streptomyces syringium]|uniref:hypothetical protein n=1 Tax=Streptomyces syringium TaxID=76729 RepID=UPI00365AAAE1
MVVLSAPSPPTGGPVPELSLTAQKLERTKSGGTLLVKVRERLDFSGGDIQPGVRKVLKARKGRTLIVDLTGSSRSGDAGALLLLLAKTRVIPDGSVVESLHKSREALESQKEELCRGDNAEVCKLLWQKVQPNQQEIRHHLRSTKALVLQNQQPDAELTLPEKSPRSADDSARPDATDMLLIALTALLGLVALAVFKTRRPVAAPATTGRPLPPGFLLSGAPTPADRPSPALTGRPRLAVVRGPSDGPVRTAVVRTCLRPQGYVEFDGWLHRATWAEASLTPPGPGARVDVVGPESGRLEAFAPGGPVHVGDRARGSAPP